MPQANLGFLHLLGRLGPHLKNIHRTLTSNGESSYGHGIMPLIKVGPMRIMFR